MFDRFWLWSCVYLRRKQIKSLLKFFMPFGRKQNYKKEKNNNTICKNFESFSSI